MTPVFNRERYPNNSCRVVVVVVSHIQRIGCQPEKTTLHGGQSRSWSAEQGKENKRKSLAAYHGVTYPLIEKTREPLDSVSLAWVVQRWGSVGILNECASELMGTVFRYPPQGMGPFVTLLNMIGCKNIIEYCEA